ncbi:SycD/LcrH family type III secretion system chaperone [Enterobacter cloacae]|uniref:SycD/LcrH family type III secretion system chaperone n=1 Tax=Enterobacter cloacae TaxID=550 RepID=UPI002FF7959A
MQNRHNDDKEVFKSDEDIESYAECLLDAIQNGANLQQIFSVPNGSMQDLYKLAYDFYHHGKLDNAESVFRVLFIYDFYNPEYAMGLAAVYQLKKNYSKAIEFYALAYSLSEQDYRPMFYAGQCNLMLRQGVQARKCFEIVISRSGEKLLTDKAKAYISALDKISKQVDNPDMR